MQSGHRRTQLPRDQDLGLLDTSMCISKRRYYITEVRLHEESRTKEPSAVNNRNNDFHGWERSPPCRRFLC